MATVVHKVLSANYSLGMRKKLETRGLKLGFVFFINFFLIAKCFFGLLLIGKWTVFNYNISLIWSLQHVKHSLYPFNIYRPVSICNLPVQGAGVYHSLPLMEGCKVYCFDNKSIV